MTFIFTLTLFMLCGRGTELVVPVGEDQLERAVYARALVLGTVRTPDRPPQLVLVVRLMYPQSSGEKYSRVQNVSRRDLWLGKVRVLKLVPPGCDRGL